MNIREEFDSVRRVVANVEETVAAHQVRDAITIREQAAYVRELEEKLQSAIEALAEVENTAQVNVVRRLEAEWQVRRVAL